MAQAVPPKVVIPTLGTQTYLEKPEQQIAYLLNHFAAAPADATVTFVGAAISLQEIMSRHSYRQAEITAPVQRALEGALNNIYGIGNARVVASTENIDDLRYNLIIQVSVVVNGEVTTLSSTVGVADGRLTFDVPT